MKDCDVPWNLALTHSEPCINLQRVQTLDAVTLTSQPLGVQWNFTVTVIFLWAVLYFNTCQGFWPAYKQSYLCTGRYSITNNLTALMSIKWSNSLRHSSLPHSCHSSHYTVWQPAVSHWISRLCCLEPRTGCLIIKCTMTFSRRSSQ